MRSQARTCIMACDGVGVLAFSLACAAYYQLLKNLKVTRQSWLAFTILCCSFYRNLSMIISLHLRDLSVELKSCLNVLITMHSPPPHTVIATRQRDFTYLCLTLERVKTQWRRPDCLRFAGCAESAACVSPGVTPRLSPNYLSVPRE